MLQFKAFEIVNLTVFTLRTERPVRLAYDISTYPGEIQTCARLTFTSKPA